MRHYFASHETETMKWSRSSLPPRKLNRATATWPTGLDLEERSEVGSTINDKYLVLRKRLSI